jgi:two-component system, LuxR family, response regulator FixJ
MSYSAATVFIVDDDASYLKSVSRLLRASGHTIQAFNSAKDFFEHLRPETRGCVIADLQMPGLNGLELQEALNKETNPLPIIFLTGQGDIPSSVRAMRHGAEDFLTKDSPKEALLAAVERALARDARERNQRERLQGLRARFAALSAREREVLSHVLRGKLNKQMAADLDINERTVKLHRSSMMRKLGIQSVAELTRMAKEAGIE